MISARVSSPLAVKHHTANIPHWKNERTTSLCTVLCNTRVNSFNCEASGSSFTDCFQACRMYMLNYCSAGAVYRFYICRCSLSQRYGCACSWAAAASWSVQAALTTCLVLEGRSRKGRNDRKGSRIPVCAEAGLLLLCAPLQRAASNSTFLPPHQRSRHRSPALHGMHTERRLHHNTAATKSVASLCSVCNLSCNEPLSCTPRLCMQHLSCSRVITIVRGSPLARSVTMLGATSSSQMQLRGQV